MLKQAGVGGGDQFLGVRARFVLETRAEVVLLVLDGAAAHAEAAMAGLQVAGPGCVGGTFHG
jgi:hypothetical protein